MNNDLYVFQQDGKHAGPFTNDALARAIFQGQFTPDAYVAPLGAPQWLHASQLPEIMAAVETLKRASSAPPPPVASTMMSPVRALALALPPSGFPSVDSTIPQQQPVPVRAPAAPTAPLSLKAPSPPQMLVTPAQPAPVPAPVSVAPAPPPVLAPAPAPVPAPPPPPISVAPPPPVAAPAPAPVPVPAPVYAPAAAAPAPAPVANPAEAKAPEAARAPFARPWPKWLPVAVFGGCALVAMIEVGVAAVVNRAPASSATQSAPAHGAARK